MVRKSRSAAAAAAAARRARTITPEPVLDEEMQDAPQMEEENQEEENGEEEIIDEDAEEERLGTPVNDSDTASRVSTPGRGRRSSIPRKRRAGRPAKSRNIDRDTPDDSGAANSDKGTPRRRGGWRGGPRGSGVGRWGKPRGGPSHAHTTRTDVHNDEVDLPEDPEGETKVDKSGQLLGEREYRVRVFTIEGKKDRLYMLSTEPARCIGFRDSYLFFQKHPNLYKIILDDDAKRDLIARDIIPHSYKGRAIGVVTARSVFREFGAKIVIAGKKVVDDYQVAGARANGDVEGELAVPDDQIPTGGKHLYDRNQYVAWHGASSVYHTGQPSVPIQIGKGPDGKKRKVVVTGDNWMFEHAQAASRYNSLLTSERRATSKGVYDIHTNAMHYPRNTQPTHARWERVPPSPSVSPTKPCTTSPDPPPTMSTSLLFHPLPPSIVRNFMITDTTYISPSIPDMPPPGPDSALDDFDTSLSSVPAEIIELLDEQQRRDFEAAREAERVWREKWGTEAEDGLRGELEISYNN